MTTSVAGKRILVVGASSGIGAAVAKQAALQQADVVVSARRREKLEALVSEMGCGRAIVGDATLAADANRIVREAADVMGGIDLVVYAAGFGVLQPLKQCDAELWTSVYQVNVIGANLIAGAALDVLGRAGVVAFVSSRTVDDGNAYFGSYSASKAALDQCIRTWRVEHPEKRFVRVLMGNCFPTEFSDHMGDELLGDALKAWEKQGIPGGVMMVDDVGKAMLSALAVSLHHPDIDMPELKMDARIDTGAEIGDMNPLDE